MEWRRLCIIVELELTKVWSEYVNDITSCIGTQVRVVAIFYLLLIAAVAVQLIDARKTITLSATKIPQ